MSWTQIPSSSLWKSRGVQRLGVTRLWVYSYSQIQRRSLLSIYLYSLDTLDRSSSRLGSYFKEIIVYSCFLFTSGRRPYVLNTVCSIFVISKTRCLDLLSTVFTNVLPLDLIRRPCAYFCLSPPPWDREPSEGKDCILFGTYHSEWHVMNAW